MSQYKLNREEQYMRDQEQCGMMGYYPFLVSEVPDGNSYFE